MKALALFAMLLPLALAGCSDTASADCIKSNSYVTPNQDEEGRYIICMTADNQFAPKLAEVPVGATVVFINEGGSHNTVSPGNWNSAIAGDSKRVNHVQTFQEAGSFDYYCQPHENIGMTGTIRVVEASP